jgi:hypothetical protein
MAFSSCFSTLLELALAIVVLQTQRWRGRQYAQVEEAGPAQTPVSATAGVFASGAGQSQQDASVSDYHAHHSGMWSLCGLEKGPHMGRSRK